MATRAKTRLIYPEFFKNEDLAACTPHARLMFAAAWCFADREGRLEDRPARLRAEAFPYENVDVDGLLNELAEHGFIRRFIVAGEKFISIPKFLDYQKPHQREARSVIPAPPPSEDLPRPDLGRPEARLGLAVAPPRLPVSVSVFDLDPVSVSDPVSISESERVRGSRGAGDNHAEPTSATTTNDQLAAIARQTLELNDLDTPLNVLVDAFRAIGRRAAMKFAREDIHRALRNAIADRRAS